MDSVSRRAEGLGFSLRRNVLAFLALWMVCGVFLWTAAANTAWAAVAEKAPHEDKRVVVAVVSDGQGPFLDRYMAQVREELVRLLGRDRPIEFLRKPDFSAGWTMDGARRSLEAAMAVPGADVVLCAGLLPTLYAARLEVDLPVPVVAGFYLDQETLSLPVSQDLRSLKKNLNFVYIPRHMRDDFHSFARLIGKGPILALADARLLRAVPGIVGRFSEIAASEGLELGTFGMAGSADKVLAALPPNVRGVYLTPAFSMSVEQWQKLINGLNDRKIPTFSLMGEEDVKRGALAGGLPAVEQRTARRVALHIQQILDGASAESLPVDLPVHMKIFLNMETARTIDFSPPYDILIDAQVVGATWQPGDKGAPLDLDTAMHMAVNGNVDMTLSRLATRQAGESSDAAASPMLPQVHAVAGYSQIDQDRSTTNQGRVPWAKTSAGLQLQQMIFDDSIISRYRQARRFLESARLDESARREDVMLAAGLNYLNLLVSRAMTRIDRENLRLTEDNLKLARVRRTVGVSGPEEVYRWEASLAEAKSRYIQRMSDEADALAQLNRALGVEQDSRWDAEPIGPKAAGRYFLDGRLVGAVRNARDMARARSFSRQVALERYSIKSLQQRIEAQQLALEQNERSFYLPKIGASVEYEHALDTKRSGTQDALQSAYRAEDDTWAVGLRLTLPLYEGGGRVQATRLAKTQLRTLEARLDRLRQITEEEVQKRINALYHSWPNIDLTAQAAESSRRNLKVVRDKYTRGKASILDLLDAQNQAIKQEQNAVIAVYSFVADMLRYQRAISWMEADRTPAERQAFVQAMHEAMTAPVAANGGPKEISNE
ncbi:MAG: TolC family protein [Desulfovibrio sp.]|uniref:TolC family protein n=1 Tax=Desulfovibrio sp. 7SRBS1 TaxID=3378064 RepID=UPI003B3D89EA